MNNNITENGEITVKGTVEKITYKNDKNGYTVAVVKCGKERLTVVGTFPFLTEGEGALFYGFFTVHPVYGEQFSAVRFERLAPEGAAAVLKYLSSGIIKGVGPSTATKIVTKFGENTIDVIQNHPEELSLIRGISPEKALKISEEYKKQYGIKDLMLLLTPYDFSTEKCVKIFRKFGADSTEIVKSNPYALCVEEIGVSFETAERLATDFKICADSEARLFAGINYIFRANLYNGHTCLPREKVINVAVKLLQSDYERLQSICDKMTETLQIRAVKIGSKEFLSLPKYFAAEEFIASRLLAVKHNFAGNDIIDELEIDYTENKLGIKFEDMQRQAIKRAFSSGLLVLTGGPGTGKTTTLNAIIDLFERRGLNIALAAPTGRAAKRMTELTGYDAKTLHRLLEVEWTDEDEQKFARNERNPLECDVIIVDESSMLDTLLFEALLRALKISCRIILVGDADQLPSISAGNVLGDIIASGVFDTVALKKVFRQARTSRIVTNAHAIIDGTPSDFSNTEGDFYYMNRASSFDVCNTVLELSSERLTAAYGFDSFKNIQVICPSRKMQTGTYNLNNLLQACLNPDTGKPQISYKGIYYREGDKVMQIKNNYDIEWQKDDGQKGYGVFNGDVGLITEINRSVGTVTIKFDDRTAIYYIEEIDQLELAYAITVHKSQGSEFDCVILPLFDLPTPLAFRNLLYTAVTRAKKLLVIVGSRQIYEKMAANDKKTLRYTLLKEFLNEDVDF